MLAINRAFRPVERWEVANITTVHRAVPVPPQLAAIPVSPGIVIWSPPFPCLLRGFTINDDQADPLVGAGAATLSIGVNQAAAAVTLLTIAIATVNFGNTICGWGVFGPVNSTNVGTNDSGIVLAPAGSVPGRAALFREIRAFSNAGTYTGTLRFRFEYRPFVGPWV